MKQNSVQGVKFLEAVPDEVDLVVQEVLSLIDSKMVEEEFSVESLEDLKKIRSDLTDLAYSDLITLMDRETAQFSLTAHEFAWLKLHPKCDWVRFLIHRYRFRIYPQLYKLSSFPPHLLIEPTSVCNLRCVMCFQVDASFSSKKEYMGMMDWDLFTSVVDQAVDNECNAITLASRGEPTLHKKLGSMLNYIHDKKIYESKLNTNATRLTPDLCHEILSADINSVVFSVDASTKDSYERIRVRGKFEKVLANVQMFNEIRARDYPSSKTTTRISGVAVEGTQNPKEMEMFWSNYVDQVAIVQETPRWDSYNNPSYPSEEVCSVLYQRMYVWYDGTCNPCDFDYKSELAVGNAKETPLSDLWLGKRYQDLRKNHETKQRHCVIPCDRCPY